MNEGGVLLLDKPAGISSFQALRPVKRAFPKTKIGHAGTLDPAATGLLLVGVGGATRLLEYLEGMPKTYSFIARFGMTSDSYDMESPVKVAEGEAAELALSLDKEKIEKALIPFRGSISQTPPDYSAIKIQGTRACDRVRAGETVTLSSREVTVHSLELKAFTLDKTLDKTSASPETVATASFVMTCSKGTYVRSLVHDLGQALGCGAVTDKIRRLAIGPFKVENALVPDAPLPATALASGDSNHSNHSNPMGNGAITYQNLLDSLLPLNTAVAHLPQARLSNLGVAGFLLGRALDATAYTLSPPLADAGKTMLDSPLEYRAMDSSGRLIAIATLSPQGLLCPKKVLVRN